MKTIQRAGLHDRRVSCKGSLERENAHICRSKELRFSARPFWKGGVRGDSLSPFASTREAGGGIAEHLSMIYAEGFDPTLLTQSERDEKPKFDQFGDGEMLMEFLPERLVGDFRVPGDGAGISQRDFLALGEFVRIGEIE